MAAVVVIGKGPGRLALEGDGPGRIHWYRDVRADYLEQFTSEVKVPVRGAGGKELVTNSPNRIRGYDPATGRELWTLGGSSKITAPTPILARDLIIVASGRAPERPIFAIRPGANTRGAMNSTLTALSRPAMLKVSPVSAAASDEDGQPAGGERAALHSNRPHQLLPIRQL